MPPMRHGGMTSRHFLLPPVICHELDTQGALGSMGSGVGCATASRQVGIWAPWIKAALRLHAFGRQTPIHRQVMHESKYTLAGEAAVIIESAHLAITPRDEKE